MDNFEQTGFGQKLAWMGHVLVHSSRIRAGNALPPLFIETEIVIPIRFLGRSGRITLYREITPRLSVKSLLTPM